MSTLHYSESGHAVPTLGEELTRYRRVRKTLILPATTQPGVLYALARPYEAGSPPLRISVNGTELRCISPQPYVFYRWFEATLPSALLKPGENTFEFWTDSTAMNAWSLAIEGGHTDPKSFVSDDAGANWRNRRMGYANILQGEYVVRVRLAEGSDPPPPPVIWEDPACPRLQSLRRLMPAEAFEAASLVDRVRSLSAWVSSAWVHHGTALGGTQYAPWDPETILAWGKSLIGHNGRSPIVNCVHYGVVFAMCAQAAGVPARCVALMADPTGYAGHFVCEVWFDDFQKWVMVDPNMDAMFWRSGRPMSVSEIQQARDNLADFVQWGKGTECRRNEWRRPAGTQHPDPFALYLSGISFNYRSIWQRADFLSRYALTPPGHGTLSFCETELVWEKRDLDRGLGMFPYFGDAAYFDAPPRAR